MMQCQAPDANVLLLLRRKQDGVVIGSVWGLWTVEELCRTFRDYVNVTDWYVGQHYNHTGPDVNIEILIVGEVK